MDFIEREQLLPRIKHAFGLMNNICPGKHGVALSCKGFSLIELLVTMVVIGALAAIAVPGYFSYLESAKAKRCAADIRTLEKDIEAFVIDNGNLPNSLSDIGRNALLDPWGNPYEYYNFAVGGKTPLQDLGLHDLNTDFDLYSKGLDGASAVDSSDPASDDDIVRAGDGWYVGNR